MTSKWKILGGKKIDSISNWVKENTSENQEVNIGTDSLQTGKFTQFVTVIVILTPGKGGRVAYSKVSEPRINNLRERLLKEVQYSLDIALSLNLENNLVLHIDANAQEEHLSSRYVQELVGYVTGMGFKSVIKPDAWASTTAADHVVRNS